MTDDIRRKLAALELVEMSELKTLWAKYFDREPVRFQREYMVRRLAYKMQVQAYGGLPKTIRNKLQRLAEQGQETVREQFNLTAGTRLIREYKGERICISVLEDGFEFKGKRYQSLTAIATELMGSRTSGPKFFGLLRGNDDT